MDNPYSTPAQGDGPLPALPHVPTPPVVSWFRVYAGAMAALYLLTTVAGVLILALREQVAASDETMPPELLLVYGVVLTLMGAGLMVFYGAGLFLPRASWAWVVGILLIGFGMTSCCCVPVCVPLLIFWLKPEAQAYFGRGASAAPPGGLMN